MSNNNIDNERRYNMYTDQDIYSPIRRNLFNIGLPLYHQGDEIRMTLNYVYNEQLNMTNIMNGLFGSINDISEDRMMEIAQEESLEYYNTQEKKPDVKLDIDESVVTDIIRDTNCAICISSFIVGEIITKLECNHVLHTNCVAEWVKYKSECPICRQSIKTVSEL